MSDPTSRPRALVYRAIGLGDLLTGVPALRALRRALPDHEIVLAAPGAQRPLVELIDAVDRLIPTEELEPVAWDGPPPDVGIDLHGNGPASRMLVEALRPRRVVGFGLEPGNPAWDPDEYERVRWCRLVVDALGRTPPAVDVLADDVLLAPPAVAPEQPGRSGSGRPGSGRSGSGRSGSGHAGAVLVHPGAASGARRWPGDRFAAVARRLAEDGREVLLTGSPAERPLAEAVARDAGLPESAVVAGETDLAALAALVADASLVVCGDTGLAHLASAYAIGSVLLFGPTPPSRWGPPPGPHTVLWHGAPGYVGDPHARHPDPALLRITVDEVLAACGC